MSAALRTACSEGGRRGGWSRDPRKRERKSPGGAHGSGGGFFVPVVGGVAAFRVWRVLSNGAVGTAGRPGKPVRLTEFSVSRTGKTDSRTGPPVVCDRRAVCPFVRVVTLWREPAGRRAVASVQFGNRDKTCVGVAGIDDVAEILFRVAADAVVILTGVEVVSQRMERDAAGVHRFEAQQGVVDAS